MNESARIPTAEITGVYGGLVKFMARRMLGRVPDSLGVMWHNPTVLKDLMGLGQKTEKWDRLDPDLASLTTMAAASHIGCSFCLDFGYFMVHNKGLDEAKAREVPRWRESAVFSDLERDAMAYAVAMSETPPTVSDELVAGLLEALGAAALLELTARVGYMNATARSNIALGIRSQEFAESCGLQPLAAPAADVVSSA